MSITKEIREDLDRLERIRRADEESDEFIRQFILYVMEEENLSREDALRFIEAQEIAAEKTIKPWLEEKFKEIFSRHN